MTDKKQREHAGQFSSIPNLQHVVQQVRDSQTWDFSTKEGLCAYANACVVALNKADPGFGHLIKSEGQNHCTDPEGRLCATDVTLYKPTGQIVDFIVSAGYGTPPPGNEVCWFPGEPGEYPASSWFAPVADDSGGGTPTPTPPVDELAEQLNRMEATLNAQTQTLAEMKLYLSNMNDQMALGFGAVNQVIARQDRPLAGNMVRHGDELTLTPR